MATVYISGCSLSHYHYLNSYKDSWSSLLGFQKVYNHAICGSSNDFIMRRAIDFCSRNKPDLVIVQWTQLPRSEVFGMPKTESEYYNEDHNYEPDYNFLQATTIKKEKPKFYEWSQNFKPDFYASVPYGKWIKTPESKSFILQEDATTSLFGLIKNAYVLQNYFKEINQSYLFVNGGDWLHSEEFGYGGDFGSWYPLDFIEMFEDGPITTIQPLASKIDKEAWPNISIMKDPPDRGYDKAHPGHLSHKAFAEKIKKYVDNRK